VKPEQHFKLMALNGHPERQQAYLAALALSDCNYEEFGFYVDRNKNNPRFLRLVVHAWEEKPSKSDLTPTGLAIIEVWSAAYQLVGRTEEGFDPFVEPTLRQVKEEFVRLFIKEQRPANSTWSQWLQELKDRGEIPSDYSIRKILDRHGLPWRKDKSGPRGPWKYGARQKNLATKNQRLVT
jgi:hypothetical protein